MREITEIGYARDTVLFRTAHTILESGTIQELGFAIHLAERLGTEILSLPGSWEAWRADKATASHPRLKQISTACA